MKTKPQTLKGFRDFLPQEKRMRDWVEKKIIETFENFGFEPLETPTLEYATLLLGKYGDEADKLVYTFEDKGKRQVGLRYDQTVPTARVLGQYQNALPKYFRRYQIQNVFRADKPQKGRYREFTQCDIDIFGSSSPLSDAEILACTYMAYKNIGFKNVKIRINDRKTLIQSLSPYATAEVNVNSIIQSIDKLDKLSKEDVIKELEAKGVRDALSTIETLESTAASQDIQEITKTAVTLGVLADELEFSPFLARGLDYYTGMIFEVLIDGYTVGSVGGGGRYDSLINDLTGTEMPAVGMAFGFDRTVEAASQLGILPDTKASSQVLVTLFDETSTTYSLTTARKLRQAGIKTEIYPKVDKLSKQFRLADQKLIPYVLVLGQDEVKTNRVTLKEMSTGEQKQVTLEEALELISRT